MRIGLVYLRPRRVVYVRRTGPTGVASAEAWAVMLDWVKRQGMRQKLGCVYGLVARDQEQIDSKTCRYDACIEIPDGFEHIRTDGVSTQMLPGGAFARVRHVGPYDHVRNAIVNVRDKWIGTEPQLALDRRRPLLIAFLDDPERRESAKLRCDVCVPVRADQEDAIGRVSRVPRRAKADLI